MKTFSIKSSPAQPAFVDILRESNNGFLVRIRRINEDFVKETEEFISKQLFDACVRTGYFTEVPNYKPESVAV
jgi:hypothetical protein